MYYIESTPISGLMVISSEKIVDDRGYFLRTFCKKTFLAAGIEFELAQSNISFNEKKGTLRGMHFQKYPHGEDKIVSCIAGHIFDVVVDLRIDSVTYLKSFAIELSVANRKSLFIPKGMAHGFQTLMEESQVNYLMSNFYVPESSTGIRYDDPVVKIQWPLPISSISSKDLNYDPYSRTV